MATEKTYDKENGMNDQIITDPALALTDDLSRRGFVASAAAVGLAASATTWGFNILHPRDAFADPNSPIEVKYSMCDMCNHVPKCGMKCFVQEGKVIRVTSREDFPNAPICSKGVASLQELYDPDRILDPMVRTTPKGQAPAWKKITWDEAYKTIAEKFNGVKAKYGADAVLFYCGDPKEMRPVMTRLATWFGSSSNGTESSVCSTATQICAQLTFGPGGPSGATPSANTKSCLIWSQNAAWSQPYAFSALLDARERGVKFVMVDPRVTPSVESLADIHLQLRPGTDGALVAGMINQIIENNYYDREFVENWTHGFDQLKEYVKDYPPQKVQEITWVPAEKLIAAAKLLYDNAPSTMVTSAKGACHQENVGNFQRGVMMIPALLGSLEVSGGIMWGMRGPISLDGNATTGAFSIESTYNAQGFRQRRHDLKDFPVWAELIYLMQTVKLPEYVKDGKIRAGLFCGTNAMMWPNTPLYQKAIQDLEFSVGIDYYARYWTHDFMDMVLPAAMCYERDATVGVYGNRIFMRQKITPQGQAREDWQILLEIGCALGGGEFFFDGSVEKAIDFNLKQGGSDITYQQLKANPQGLTLPTVQNEPKKHVSGKIRSDGKPGFNTPTGKIELVSTVLEKHGFNGLPIYKEPTYMPTKEYPLLLNTGSRLPFYTHSKLRGLPWLNQFMPDPVIRMNKIDAEDRGIQDGDWVRVFNFQGEIKVRAAITNMVMPGVTDIYHGWAVADVNKLTTRNFCPITGFPGFSTGVCEIAKA